MKALIAMNKIVVKNMDSRKTLTMLCSVSLKYVCTMRLLMNSIWKLAQALGKIFMQVNVPSNAGMHAKLITQSSLTRALKTRHFTSNDIHCFDHTNHILQRAQHEYRHSTDSRHSNRDAQKIDGGVFPILGGPCLGSQQQWNLMQVFLQMNGVARDQWSRSYQNERSKHFDSSQINVLLVEENKVQATVEFRMIELLARHSRQRLCAVLAECCHRWLFDGRAQ